MMSREMGIAAMFTLAGAYVDGADPAKGNNDQDDSTDRLFLSGFYFS